MEHYQLANGIKIPKIGFGTWKLEEGDQAYQSVLKALEVGYRHIDTAQVYGNEVSVGKAIKDSKVPRDEIFLTTKIWNDKHSYSLAKESVEESLTKLQVDYLDLLLIHWPNPIDLRKDKAWMEANREVWQLMEELYQAGKVKAIGVSNFMINHLEALLPHVKIKPMVNQILLAPGTTQPDLVNFCRQHDILLEAYSPLGSGSLFEQDAGQEMAAKYQKSLAQVALRWSLDKGFLPLPKSKTPANITANLEIFDFTLEPEDIDQLDHLPGVKTQNNPDEVDF
ncbi:aldo/keto reductase [Facklamia miroungae]|uniref:Aldo/keto reductase n=1 Tax=Facklamia miroungae TaxID=120956 RepID=A0A1G7PJX3_9LACT|nr:aldo/keto reductase [Facklamia miroungae]NKZ28736.1 aldo/keto reductase [Facklamia miroungae]SDF86424.1 Aldo/keto reductase [Facklamia miroungae]